MDKKTEIIETDDSKVEESVETFIESAERTVEELKVVVMDKTAEIEDLHNLVLEKEEDFNKAKSSLEARIAELEAALTESNKSRDELLSEISENKLQALVKERLEVLKANDLLRSEEEAQRRQAEKIKLFSDEEFNEYVVELSDIKGKASMVVTEDEAVKSEETAEVTVELIEKLVGRSSTEDARKCLKIVLDSLQSGEALASEETEEVEQAKEVAEANQQDVSVERLTEAFTLIALRNKKK